MSRRLVIVVALLAALLIGGVVYERFASTSQRMRDDPAASRGAMGVKPGVVASVPLKVTVAPNAQKAGDAVRSPLPAPGSPFVEIYGNLKARVAQGDHRAACRIGFELDRCANLKVFRGGPDFWRKAMADPRLPPERRSSLEKNAAGAQRQLEEVEKVCVGVPATETARTWDYFLAAALAGNEYAMWRVSNFPPGLNPTAREDTLEGWAQWRQYAPALIEEGVRRGDPRMVFMASKDSMRARDGIWLRPRDPVKALAYQMALVDASSPAYRAIAQRDLDYLLSQLKAPESQVSEARRFASTVALRAPPGGVDFSRGMDPDRNARQCEEP